MPQNLEKNPSEEKSTKKLSTQEGLEIIKLGIEKELGTIKKDTQKILCKIRTDFECMKAQFVKFMSQTNEHIKNSHESMKQHEEFLKDLSQTNHNVEETLGNIFLAIRQNEYLQAWYPEQHGFPAMKVSGIHPAKLK